MVLELSQDIDATDLRVATTRKKRHDNYDAKYLDPSRWPDTRMGIHRFYVRVSRRDWSQPLHRVCSIVGRARQVQMEVQGSSGEPLPSWLAVSLLAGLLFGLLPALLGVLLTLVGGVVDICGDFGEFGCAGYLVLGLYACPGDAVVAALVGGLSAARMSKAGAAYSRRDVWKQSFALAFCSLLLSGPISVSVLGSL